MNQQDAPTDPGDHEAGVRGGAGRLPRGGGAAPAPAQPRAEEEGPGESEQDEGRNTGTCLDVVMTYSVFSDQKKRTPTVRLAGEMYLVFGKGGGSGFLRVSIVS